MGRRWDVRLRMNAWLALCWSRGDVNARGARPIIRDGSRLRLSPDRSGRRRLQPLGARSECRVSDAATMSAYGAFQTQGASQNSGFKFSLSHLERVVGGASRPMFSLRHRAARSSTDRLDVQIWRTDTRRRSRLCPVWSLLGDDDYVDQHPGLKPIFHLKLRRCRLAMSAVGHETQVVRSRHRSRGDFRTASHHKSYFESL